MDHQSEAARALHAHAESIEVLHVKLQAVPGVDAERLKKAVEGYKRAHQQFTDDALGCMN